ncbi:hypothetical protein [Vibrio phage phiKT1028]|nr:hypothetical protein [Vibrio phage phiKT1028]
MNQMSEPFEIVDFQDFLAKELSKLGQPSKYTTLPELYEEYSVPFGKSMLGYLKQFDVDSRWLHDAYGLDFRKNKKGNWDVFLNEMVGEFLHFNSGDQPIMTLTLTGE